MDVFRHLDRSNCGECGVPTCMAFAAMVVQGQKRIEQCPHLDAEVAERLAAELADALADVQKSREEQIARLRDVIRDVDLAEAARRVGGSMNGDRIRVRCLGKDFELDPAGNLYSECHVNMWVHLPLLEYVAHGQGKEPLGRWVPFRDLRNAKDWVRFFAHRCEGEIRKIADLDPGLFLDTLDLFSARSVVPGTSQITASADDVYVLYPMPTLPVLIAYWRSEGEFDSRLTLLFDESAADNLGAGAIFRLMSGIVEMLRKIMQRHGYDVP
jgi:hypothetical protein